MSRASVISVDGPATTAARPATDPVARTQAPWVGAEPPVGLVVGPAAMLLLVVALVEIQLRGTVGMGTGVALVLVAVATALAVRIRDLFTAGVLPPLLLVAVLVVVAVAQPAGIRVTELDPTASVVQRVIAGFVDLAGALVVAHALALVLVALRMRVARRQRRTQVSP